MELTNEERELLLAAERGGGRIHSLTAQQLPGAIIEAGGVHFNNDPARAARFRDALDSLVARKYAKHEGGQLHVLTGAGWTKARELMGS